VCLLWTVWKWRSTKSHIVELEAALAIALKQRAAERTGRIRAQRELRQALLGGKNLKEGNVVAYPMTPIGTVRSCFSTRYGVLNYSWLPCGTIMMWYFPADRRQVDLQLHSTRHFSNYVKVCLVPAQ
jgi:hypothetical protein